jgi:hypothetical protein
VTKRPRKPSKPLLIAENAPLQSRPVKRRDPKQPHLPFDPMPDRVEALSGAPEEQAAGSGPMTNGTGFKHDVGRSLKKQLDKLKTLLPPVRVPGKNLVLTAPALVAEIEYRAWDE